MQIFPNVHSLRIPFQVVAGTGKVLDRFVNIFVLLGTRTWVIDTGVAGSETVLFQSLEDCGRKPESLERVLLTHGHADHIGAAQAVCAATGARVFAHPAERSWIENIETQAIERPVPGFHQLVGGSVPIDHELTDGQRLELEPGLTVQVIHTPGHSPGSVSFYLPEQGLLITGDAVPVPGDLPVYDDPQVSVSSLLRLQSLRGVRVLLSSWDEPRSGEEVQATLHRALQLIERIHCAVRAVSRRTSSPDPLTLCLETLKELALPEAMANPMVARTFLGHYALRDREALR